MGKNDISEGKTNPKNPIANGEETIIKGLGFCSFGQGSNVAAVDVKDNKLVRIRPLYYDWKYKAEEFNPWTIEARGKTFRPTMKSLLPPFSVAYKKRVYSPNRILYPLKRVDWDPEGERHPENRGKSSYVRISWDEALSLVASEIRRVHKKYGPYGILCQIDGHGESKVVHGPHGCNRPLLDLMGGYTMQARNPDSWEGWVWGAKHAWGMEPVGQMRPQTNVFPDVAENSDLILFWGCDPETTPWGWSGQLASRLCYWFKELGIKSIYICPDLNYGAAVHADKWIPIKPNTDAALHLAIAYIWITENTYDKEYVRTHTYGFEKFEEYVLGKEDGIPKTAKWAEQKTGVPSRTIKALAKDWASKRTAISHGNGGAYIRGPYSTEPARLEVCLLAMQGLGKPGVHQVKMIEWGFFNEGICVPTHCLIDTQTPLPGPVVIPNIMSAYRGGDPSFTKLTKQIIPKNRIHDAILNPPISWYGSTLFKPVEEQFRKFTYPAEGCPEIHMIWTDSPCWITCWNDGNAFISALRNEKIEFILAQHPWLESDCLFADIILPSNTKFEEEDIGVDTFSGQFYTVFHEKKCIEAVGESKSDYEIVCMIAEKLGLYKEYTEGRNVGEWIKFGFEHSRVENMISYDNWKNKGYFVIPTDPDWKKHKPGMRTFYEDPENNPVKTPSGKIEFYSQNLAKHFPGDNERPPVPHWIESGITHDERLSSERAKKYPLLIMSNHGRWRVHANLDDVTWFHEIETCKVRGADGYLYEPLWINRLDAEKRGIVKGDIVKAYNERGAVLGGAYLTERIMPGTVYMDHGARYDPIVPGELDRGGAINSISPHGTTSQNATGMASSGYLVEVELANMSELMNKYPEAFSRPYDAGAGLRMERVLEK
jgi:molybdopterin guanine dinucleotide-containing S/N-oxide reductase-like protein